MSPLVESLEAFTDPQSEVQLQALDASLQAVSPDLCGVREIRALLSVFERFPEQDGFGVFWGILHALEGLKGYEPELVASVHRKPCEFNVLMVNRLLNAGVMEVNGNSLEGLLLAVEAHGQATEQARREVQYYLARRAGASEA